MMSTLALKFFDETLRDGEQQAGLFFPYEDKIKLTHLIAKTGVSHIDIMPIIDKSEERLVKRLVADGFGCLIAPATMMGKLFINQSKACGVERIILFNAISDRLLLIRDKASQRSLSLSQKPTVYGNSKPMIDTVRQNMIDNVLENLKYATSKEVNLKIDFAAEDASRADFGFLVRCIQEFKPFIDHFMLCDTVGVLEPRQTHSWVSKILNESQNAPIAVHFHNDMGIALENTLQAIEAGASMVSGTFGGIGERAGNVALEQVFNGLRLRYGIEVDGINYDAVSNVIEYLDRLNAHPAPPYSKAASRHETGIHISSMLRDPQSYTMFPHDKPDIWFGKCSGSSNFEYIFEKKLNMALSKHQYNKMRIAIKALSINKKRCFSTDEVIEMYRKGLLDV